MEQDVLEITTKILAMLGGLVALFKISHGIFAHRKENLRIEYEFAEKFIDNDRWKTMNDYLLEMAYLGLSGKKLMAQEIKYIIAGKNPLEKF